MPSRAWRSDVPDSEASAKFAAEDMQGIRKDVGERLEVEHVLGAKEDELAREGLHREGSAVCFVRAEGQQVDQWPDLDVKAPAGKSNTLTRFSGYLLVMKPRESGTSEIGGVYFWDYNAPRDEKKLKWVPFPLGFLSDKTKVPFSVGVFIPGLVEQGNVPVRIPVPALTNGRLTRLRLISGFVDDSLTDRASTPTTIVFSKSGARTPLRLVLDSGEQPATLTLQPESGTSGEKGIKTSQQAAVVLDINEDRNPDTPKIGDGDFLNVRVDSAGHHGDVLCVFEGFHNLVKV